MSPLSFRAAVVAAVTVLALSRTVPSWAQG
jgi:hypothetical protein